MSFAHRSLTGRESCARRRASPSPRQIAAALAVICAALSVLAPGSIPAAADPWAQQPGQSRNPTATGPTLPPIRLSASNQVPDCVTPERLMAFLRGRHPRLQPQFSGIAEWYFRHGEAWRVRWDYAFFQMLLETNFLTYRKPDGDWGDVRPSQNNFAGLGTTGGGVPGDSYPDVSTGVLAQIQHLVAYSGELLDDPVGPRTRLKQDVIVQLSAPIAARRPVTFQDLSGRWAVDRAYGRSIRAIAKAYEDRFCPEGLERSQSVRRKDQAVETRTAAVGAERAGTTGLGPPPPPRLATPRLQAPSAPMPPARSAAPPTSCSVSLASFGGTRTILIRSIDGEALKLTALEVLPDQAQELINAFIESYARGGEAIGNFSDRRAALQEAYRLCPAAAEPLRSTSRG